MVFAKGMKKNLLNNSILLMFMAMLKYKIIRLVQMQMSLKLD